MGRYRCVDVRCPKCNEWDSRVIDCNGRDDGRSRRRRECACGHRFTTTELLADDLDAMVARLAEIERVLSQLRSAYSVRA